MSISTLESPASRRALSTADAESEQRAAMVASLAAEFKAAAARADAAAIATFAGTCTNWGNPLPGGGHGKRLQTVGEVAGNTLEYGFTQRAIQVLMNAAAGRASQRDAQQLLDELAATWADQHADDYL